MLVKDLVKTLSKDTTYSIKYAFNPHCTIWYGKGGKAPGIVDNEIVKSIQHTPKKIIIYI